MITARSTCSCNEDLLSLSGADPDSTLFFDIETTGFSPLTSAVYLIGAAFRSGGEWQILQWMSEAPGEEDLLLRLFAGTAGKFRFLLHFNGDRFDIPYLEEKFREHRIPSPFDKLRSIDIYREAKRLKHFLGLSRLNQKSLEQFLGLCREDLYGGGELISVYREFVKTGDERHRELLLLHNREDVCGMTALLGLYAFSGFLDRICACETYEAGSAPDSTLFPGLNALMADRDGSFVSALGEAASLQLTWRDPAPVPVPFRKMCREASVSLSGCDRSLTVPVLHGELKHFFDSCKDYFYLPREDEAIHKSVAVYVDKAYRTKATKENCYIRRSGNFLPLGGIPFSPSFREDFSSRDLYFMPEEDFCARKDRLTVFLASMLTLFR